MWKTGGKRSACDTTRLKVVWHGQMGVITDNLSSMAWLVFVKEGLQRIHKHRFHSRVLSGNRNVLMPTDNVISVRLWSLYLMSVFGDTIVHV